MTRPVATRPVVGPHSPFRFLCRASARLFDAAGPPAGAWAVGTLLLAAAPAGAAGPAVRTLDDAIARELQSAPYGVPRSMPQPVWTAPRAMPAAAAMAGPIRLVAGEAPTAPSKSAAPNAVLDELEQMYQREGREMPSMKLRDQPHARTYAPSRPKTAQSAPSSAAAPPTARPPVANPPAMIPSAPKQSPVVRPPVPSRPAAAPASYTTAGAETGALPSDEADETDKRPSFFGRLMGRGPSKTAAAPRRSGGLFGRMLGVKEPQPVADKSPPVPPPLTYGTIAPVRPALSATGTPAPPPAPAPLPPAPSPQFVAPARPAVRDVATTPRPSARETVAPFVAPSPTAPVSPAPAVASGDPFAEVRIDEQDDPFAEAFVASRSASSPSSDPFAEVRIDEPTAEVDPFAEVAAPRYAAVDDAAPARLDVAAGEAKPADPAERARDERYADLQTTLAERTSLGGFQGFCPVALRDRRQLADSRPEYVSLYEGRTYTLSSAEAKARFDTSPQRYAPVAGGLDVVLARRGQTDVTGCLAHAVWFKDRLYLFQSAESVLAFNAVPASYAVAD